MQPKVSAKSKKTQTSRTSKQKKEFVFPLERQNFMIIGLGILVILAGYFVMSGNTVDGFMPTVLAPILLVLGYCVLIPYGILKKTKIDASVTSAETSVETNTASATISSNIKTS